jgi:hypothetical protein
MEEAAKLTPIYGGISYERLEQGGLQWPCRNLQDPGTKYLHEESFTRGRGQFTPVRYEPAGEAPDEIYGKLTTAESLSLAWWFYQPPIPRINELCPKEGLKSILKSSRTGMRNWGYN